jgi:Icc-related predicted phosphoesterase
MKILFTSDLHGLESAYRDFAQLLKSAYDVGVIAGDLHDDYLPKEEIQRLLNLRDDDMLEELHSDEELNNPGEFLMKSIEGSYLFKALKIKVAILAGILNSAEKPILLIEGNHDLVGWHDNGHIINIDGNKVNLNGYNFVGYRHTTFEKTEVDQRADMPTIERLIDKKTILVTHSPPWGIMDESASFDYRKKDAVHIGSKPIKDLIMKKPPLLHLFGHVHESFGIRGRFINGSYPTVRRFISIDTSTGKISFVKSIFPVLFSCKCSKKLKASHAGQFKCPQCKTLLTIDESGKVE